MSFFGRLLFGTVALGIAAVVAVAIGLAIVVTSVLPELPEVSEIRQIQLRVPLRVVSTDEQLIAEFGEERRSPVAIAEVPERLIQAVLAAEDDAFYRHPGVDVTGIVRAAIANFRARGTEQGGSTITMQVARNYFLTPERTYIRKLKEILLAFRIEREMSKDEILELYVNKIFLGNRAYGFAAASRVYYGRDLDELTVPEIAMLAGLPKAPSRSNPFANPDLAMSRRSYVLGRMHTLGHIDDDQLEEYLATPLTAERQDVVADVAAPFAAEMVRLHMLERYGEEVYFSGYVVHTTIDPRQQAAADRALRNGLIDYDMRYGYRGPAAHRELNQEVIETLDTSTLRDILATIPRSADLHRALVTRVHERTVTVNTVEAGEVVVDWGGLSWARPVTQGGGLGAEPQRAADIVRVGDVIYVRHGRDEAWWLAQPPEIEGAVVSLDPQDGAIRAVSGGFDFWASNFNRAVQAVRQPGSSIKPFVFSAALEQGFTAATTVSGAPIVVEDTGAMDELWRPANYSGEFFGPTRLREALSRSLNLVAVRLVRAVGPAYTVQHMLRFGFLPEQLPPTLSLALGAASVTPMDMARAYAVFANGGFLIDPYIVTRVVDSEGNVIEEATPRRACPECTYIPPPASDEQDGAQGEPDVMVHALGVDDESGLAPRVLSPQNAYVMHSMMQQVMRTGTGARAGSLGRNDLAGKTGTTNDFRDAWFAGYNGDLVGTVWAGFDQPKSLGRGEAGGRVALPIWIDFMQVALDGRPEHPLPRPDRIVTGWIHPETGEAMTQGQAGALAEVFIVGTEPVSPAYATERSGSGDAGAGTSAPSASDSADGLF